ncbi:MAG: hypothetical protein R3F65_04435 [bacterium]|nr:hypothetical protein [Myxococcales bacterium]
MTDATTPAIERLLRRARRHPFYRDVDADFTTLADVPVMSKARLAAALRSMEADPRFAYGTYWTRSGGSSGGPPVYVPVGLAENQRARRILAGHLRRVGVFTDRTVALNLFWSGRLYRSCELFTDLCTYAGATSLPLTTNAPIEALVEVTRRFRPDTLLADPTDVVRTIIALRAMGERVGFRRLVYGANPLPPHTEAYLREHLGIEAVYSVMGSAEAGLWGYHTPADARRHFRVAPELVHVEILDPDASGGGRLVLTPLARVRHPILRFDTGDRARLVEPASADGPAVVEFLGRSPKDFFLGGHIISPASFDALRERALGLQLVLDLDPDSKLDSLCVKVTMREGDDPAAVRRLYEETIDALPFAPEERDFNARFVERRLELCALETLTREPASGKLIPVIDRRDR